MSIRGLDVMAHIDKCYDCGWEGEVREFATPGLSWDCQAQESDELAADYSHEDEVYG